MTTTELHPEAQMVIDSQEELGIPQFNSLSVRGARELLNELWALPDDPEPVQSVSDYVIDGLSSGIPIRVYRPEGSPPFPVLVFLHGGGWVTGNLDTHDSMCRALTNAGDCVVVSVEYRLAPEHPFPAAVEDCYAATKWAEENASAIHGDPSRLAIGGDSAGGNLAAVVSQRSRDRDGPDLAYQLLIYPVTDRSFDTTSYEENAEGYLLTKTDMEWYWDLYLEHDVDGRHPYASPLKARDLSGLPPATVVTCGFDPLRDEGIAYANRLEGAGVDVELRNYGGQIHGFMGMLADPELDHARMAIEDVSRDLNAELNT